MIRANSCHHSKGKPRASVYSKLRLAQAESAAGPHFIKSDHHKITSKQIINPLHAYFVSN